MMYLRKKLLWAVGVVLLFCFTELAVAIPLSELNLTETEKRYLKDKQQIKVCIDPLWMPFEMNDNGKHIGLTSEYMSLFSETLSIPVSLHSTSSWLDSIQALKSGQCDLLTSVAITEQRKSFLNFSQPYINSSLVVATGLHQPWINSLRDLTGARIGVVAGYASGDYIRHNYPEIELVDIASIRQGLERVAKGELFGVVGLLANIGYHIQKEFVGSLKIAGKLEGEWPVHLGVSKREPQLVTVLNKLINLISVEEHQSILNKWVSVSISHDDPNRLTPAEQRFLTQNPVIRFRTRSNRAPFEFESQGEAAGIAVDYIKMIAQNLGFTAEFIFDDRPQPEAFSAMEQGRVPYDTLLYSVINPERAKRFVFGDAFLSYPVMVVTNKNSAYVGKPDDLAGRSVAMEKGFVTTKWIKRDFPLIEVIETSNTYQALKLVDSGLSDAYIGNLAIANYLIAKGEMKNIKVSVPTSYNNIEYRFIAPKEWPELASILSKGFRMISPKQHSAIQQSWFSLQTIEKVNYTLVWTVLFVALVVISGFVYSHKQLVREKQKSDQLLLELRLAQQSLEKKNSELKKLSITDRLTGLYNRVELEAVLQKEFNRAYRYGDVYSLMMLDVDKFKHINDSLGHQHGDQILKELSVVFLNNIRKVDTVGRWGGEEFLIICPRTDSQDAEKFAEILRGRIEKHMFSQSTPITVSIGVTSYQPHDTIAAMVSKADKALYKAKERGRNRVESQLS